MIDVFDTSMRLQVLHSLAKFRNFSLIFVFYDKTNTKLVKIAEYNRQFENVSTKRNVDFQCFKFKNQNLYFVN